MIGRDKRIHTIATMIQSTIISMRSQVLTENLAISPTGAV